LAKSGGQRRRLSGEAATLLLVKKSPPDEALRDIVYDYIRDFYASDKSCVPRALEGQAVRSARFAIFFPSILIECSLSVP
jgi:hypothetical protein